MSQRGKAQHRLVIRREGKGPVVTGLVPVTWTTQVYENPALRIILFVVGGGTALGLLARYLLPLLF